MVVVRVVVGAGMMVVVVRVESRWLTIRVTLVASDTLVVVERMVWVAVEVRVDVVGVG